MSERGALLPVLERLFAGPRESSLTLDRLLAGLEARSYFHRDRRADAAPAQAGPKSSWRALRSHCTCQLD